MEFEKDQVDDYEDHNECLPYLNRRSSESCREFFSHLLLEMCIYLFIIILSSVVSFLFCLKSGNPVACARRVQSAWLCMLQSARGVRVPAQAFLT